MGKIISLIIVSAMFLTVSSAFAGGPVENVSPKMHPNIAAAQSLSRQAYEKIVVAQKANNYDMEGHAEKAKALLIKVNEELRLAAEDANKNAKKK